VLQRTLRVTVAAAVLTAATTTGLPTASLAATAANTLVVNANVNLRPVTHVASGGLYGLADDATPADRYVQPLHPNTFVQMAPGGRQLPNGEPVPAGDALVVAGKAARAGAKVIVRMPDWYPDFPYKWVSWSDWLAAVDTQVTSVKSSGASNISAYEIWNEPDWTWDTSAAGSFNAGWVRTYQQIKTKDTTTPIVGPSIAAWNASSMQSFLSYAKANNALPDQVSWHELQSAAGIADHVAAYRAIESSLGISARPIVIEEYATPSEMGVPGALVSYLAKFERTGVDNAELAFWYQYGTMGDTLTGTGGLPNGSWWLYKWYGDMSGQMVRTVPPSQTGIDGAAAYDASKHLVSVVFGNGSGTTAVTVNGLSSLSGFGSSAHVKLEYTASRGRTTAVTGAQIIAEDDFAITNGSITVPVAMNPAYGYHLQITPAGTSAPNVGGTYKLVNANSGLLLGVQDASTSSGVPALQWTDNGTRDHLWDLVDTGTGAYRIVNENSGLVLGVSGSSTAAGAPVQQQADTGGTAQLWQLVDGGSGRYKIRNVNSGLLLGITNASTSVGATALQWTDNGTADHLWTLAAARSVTNGASYTVTNSNSGLNLDTQNAATAQGTLAVQATATTGTTQSWRFTAVAGTGYYKITNQGSGLLLGIQNASTSAGADALIWGDNGTTDHLWQVIPNGDGTYKIANANSGLLLGVTNASTAAGALVLQWGDNGTTDHLWRLTQR